MEDSVEYSVNYDDEINKLNKKNSSSNVVDITEFSKILIDFLNDLVLTFPEKKIHYIKI